MNIGSSTSSGSYPTNPYHIARAYGLPNARQAQFVPPSQGVGAATAVEPVRELRVPAKVQPVQRINPKGYSAEVQQLLAGTVPGGVDFHADGSASPSGGAEGGGALPFYRHPADRNSAATAVTVGRALDVNG